MSRVEQVFYRDLKDRQGELRPGQSLADLAASMRWGRIEMSIEADTDRLVKLFPRAPFDFFAPKAPVGWDEEAKLVRIVGDSRAKTFLGFAEQCLDSRRVGSEFRNELAVWQRGSVFLYVSGLSQIALGGVVFVNAPNSFSVTKEKNGLALGKIRTFEPGHREALVDFGNGESRSITGRVRSFAAGFVRR